MVEDAKHESEVELETKLIEQLMLQCEKILFNLIAMHTVSCDEIL